MTTSIANELMEETFELMVLAEFINELAQHEISKEEIEKQTTKFRDLALTLTESISEYEKQSIASLKTKEQIIQDNYDYLFSEIDNNEREICCMLEDRGIKHAFDNKLLSDYLSESLSNNQLYKEEGYHAGLNEVVSYVKNLIVLDQNLFNKAGKSLAFEYIPSPTLEELGEAWKWTKWRGIGIK